MCPTLGHMAADIDMPDTSVTQSFSSIWQQRPLSDSTPPLSPTVSREPFQFHGICHSKDSDDYSSTPLSGELLWSLGSLSVVNVFVKTPERYEHVAVPLSDDLYMVREKAYVDYIPCPGSGPGSPALSVLSEAALPEIDDDFPKIDDSRPVITEIEGEEETSKIEVPKIESTKTEEGSILQPSQTRDWLATVLEKRQATPENEAMSALLKEQAALDEEQLKRAVYVLRIMDYPMGGLKLTHDTDGTNAKKPMLQSHVSTSAPVCVPVYRRKVARSQRTRRGTQHHHHHHPPFRNINNIRRIKFGLVEGKEVVDADHHYRESEQGEEAAMGKLDRVLSLLPSSTHACPMKRDGGIGYRGSSKPSTSSPDLGLNRRQGITKPSDDIKIHPATGRASQSFDHAAERATGCLDALRPVWATKHHLPPNTRERGSGILHPLVGAVQSDDRHDFVFVPCHYAQCILALSKQLTQSLILINNITHFLYTHTHRLVYVI